MTTTYLIRKYQRRICGVAFGAVGCLLSLMATAQDRLTYGVEVGVGSSQLYNGLSHGSAAADPFSEYYAQVNSQDGGGASVLQMGGYVRYYVANAFFVQSGLGYSYSGGSVDFTTESRMAPDEAGTEWEPGFHVDQFSVRHRYHQVEVPLLLGVRFAKQLRLYAGPVVGVALRTSTQVNMSREYALSNDPVFRSLRVGIGADMKRLSLDIYRQETFPNSNASTFEVSRPLPNYFPSSRDVSAGYGNVALSSIVVSVGYRLQ